MLTIEDRGIWSWVTPDARDITVAAAEINTLRDQLSIPLAEGTSHPYANEDGVVCWLISSQHRYAFPRGFADDIVIFLREMGFDVRHVQHRPPIYQPDYTGADTVGELLRNNYQRSALQKMIQHTNGIAWLFPRFGKMYLLVAAWIAWGRPRLAVLTPRASIIAQALNDLPKVFVGEDIGYICSDLGPPKIGQITFVSPASLVQGGKVRDELLPWVHALEARVIDECHIGDVMARAIAEAACNCSIQWGMSATPFTGDALKNRELVAFTGPVRMRMRASDGAKAGLCAGVLIRWYEILLSETMAERLIVRTKKDNHPANRYKRIYVDNDAFLGNLARIAQHHLGQGLKVVCFVERKAAAVKLSALIPGSIIADGSVPAKRKLTMAQQFNETAEVNCAVTTKTWREGITLFTDVILNGAGLRAAHVQEQMYGRGLLLKEDNRPLVLYDFAVYDEKGTFLDQARERQRHYDSEGWPSENHGRLQC